MSRAAKTKRGAASGEFRRRLLAGEPINGAEFVADYGVRLSTVHTAASVLRRQGHPVVNENGTYRLVETTSVNGATREQEEPAPRARKEPASVEFRRRLLAGEVVDSAAFQQRRGVTQGTMHSLANRLRAQGLSVVSRNGKYRLETVPPDVAEQATRATSRTFAKTTSSVLHPPLGASLRVVRVELVGRRVVTLLDDGEGLWVGSLVRDSDIPPESSGDGSGA